MKNLVIYLTTAALITAGSTFKIKNDETEIEENTNKYTTEFIDDDFDIAAHRGYSSKEIENSKQAIKLASQEKYIDYIEVDIRLTNDKKLILSHNDKIYSKENGQIKISETSFDEINNNTYIYKNKPLSYFITNPSNLGENIVLSKRKLNLTNKEFEIATIKDLLDNSKGKKLLIDIKFENNIDDMVNAIYQEFKNINTENIIFQSADLTALEYFKEKTNFKCSALISKEKDLKYIDVFQNVGIRKNLISKELVKKLINDNKIVAVWTVDTEKEIEKIANETGEYYDNIIYITNYPDMISKELNEIKKEKQLTK